MWYTSCLLRNTPTGVGKTRTAPWLVRPFKKHPHGRGEDEQQRASLYYGLETPPRAWGRREILDRPKVPLGNTPTGVGKTRTQAYRLSCLEKHPHGRGEDCLCNFDEYTSLETPPRAWGRPHASHHTARAAGNTPTGVGKTLVVPQYTGTAWKHPHGRGEDSCMRLYALDHVETPPRAWGRPDVPESCDGCTGNTPTGVGKTHARIRRGEQHEKHPHGRGEDTNKL